MWRVSLERIPGFGLSCRFFCKVTVRISDGRFLIIAIVNVITDNDDQNGAAVRIPGTGQEFRNAADHQKTVRAEETGIL